MNEIILLLLGVAFCWCGYSFMLYAAKNFSNGAHEKNIVHVALRVFVYFAVLFAIGTVFFQQLTVFLSTN